MSYTFETSVDDGILTVRLGGTRPALDSDVLEQQWGFWSRATDECRRLGITRILSVHSPSGRVSSSATLTWYSRLGDVGFDKSMSIALVIADHHGRSVLRLGAAAAVNRGWKVKVFDTEAEARAWLTFG